VGSVWPRHGHCGRPLNKIVMRLINNAREAAGVATAAILGGVAVGVESSRIIADWGLWVMFGFSGAMVALVPAYVIGVPLLRLQSRVRGHAVAWMFCFIAAGFIVGAGLHMALFESLSFDRDLFATYGAIGASAAFCGWAASTLVFGKTHNNALEADREA
jgi:hypothetical protein